MSEIADGLALCLRRAQMDLVSAVEMIEAAPDDAFGPPGKGYLLGKLELVLAVVEEELPEFRKAAEANMTRRLFEQLIQEPEDE